MGDQIELWFVRMEANWKSLSRHGHGVNDYLLIRKHFIPFEPFNQVVHEDKYFQAGVLFTRAHPRSATKGNECVRSRPVSFKSCRVKFFGLREAFWAFVG